MCGINGYIQTGSNNTYDHLETMNNAIIHRGPDDDGQYTSQLGSTNIGLGMRRLSIIDLNNGSQPIISQNGDLVIVFNGEIYNYGSLKSDLILKHGVIFNTNSDTEVVLKLYEIYKEEAFNRLDGMFAFSILDKSREKVFIARDYFGEKPLYYSVRKDKVVWSSELKSMLRAFGHAGSIDKSALSLFFQLTYIPAPYTIYENIKKLRPNHYLEVSIHSLNVTEHPISKPETSFLSSMRFSEAKKITRELVSESVISRSISDVPIGAFLSGGVDSSIISYCLSQYSDQRISTFSIGFDKKTFDETDKSKTVANLINSKHHEFIVEERSLKNDLSKILSNFDEPFGDSSALPSYILSKITSGHVKVALTGDGGDEAFGGYNKYHMNAINDVYTKLVPKRMHNVVKTGAKVLLRSNEDKRGAKWKVLKTVNSIDYSGDYYWNILSLGFKGNEINDLMRVETHGLIEKFKQEIGLHEASSLHDLRRIDRLTSLEGDMLVKVDRTSMLSSLECRSPFLNKGLWNFVDTLPEKYLINGGSKKFLLKESFKNVFPHRFLDKPKKGFGVPVGDWLRSFLKEELISYIDKVFIEEQNLFEHSEIESLVTRHINGYEDNTFKVWTYFCFQKWYKEQSWV